MRWLVPRAAASCRRLRSPIPCSATWSTVASSNRCRAFMYHMVQSYRLVHVEEKVMLEIDLRERSAAAPDKVYAVLADGAQWPECSSLGSFVLERPGETEREGAGAIRIFKTGTVSSRELVVEAVPGRRYAYTMLSGMPLRDYRVDIELTPDGDGTVIAWRSRFTAKYPGTGWFYRALLRRVIGGLVRGLAARAAVSADRPA